MKLVLVFASLCGFFLPLGAFASVVINEVAWMGSSNGGTSLQDANDEWIELRNTGDNLIDLSGWTLQAADGKPSIMLDSDHCVNTALSASGYFLLERSDDTTVPNVMADCIYKGALSNAGEVLILKNASSIQVYQVDGSNEWKIGGDNKTKETLQKTSSGWITAEGTPKAKNAGSSGSQTEYQGPETSSQPSTTSSSPEGGSTQVIEKKITADAGDDKTVIVGVAAKFMGSALGFKNEPLNTADFLWSFGDGSMARGRTVFHTFYYPGVYNVDLNVSAGDASAVDRIVVTAIPNEIKISEVKPGVGGWIELHNNSQFDIDLSRWGIGNGVSVYSLSQNTKILGGAYTVIPYEVSGIAFLSSGMASLIYPKGTMAQEFQYSGTLRTDESFHNIQGSAKIGLESPGSERFIVRSINRRKVFAPTTGQSLALTKEMNAIEAEEIEKNLALAKESLPQKEKLFSETILWFGIALGIGLLSAIGYLFIKRKGFL